MNSNSILDLLLIQSYDIKWLIDEYRYFFYGLIPTMFILVCIVEYFDRMNWQESIKRSVISVLILSSVGFFYKSSIYASIEAADNKLKSLKQSNILLMDMFDGAKSLGNKKPKFKAFYKDNSILDGTLSFLKYHLFGSFINDGFTISVFFISKLCFVLLKAIYSLVYYLGIGLIGIPCILYMFPTMGNVLRGSVISYLWCLIVPHILVFILSLIGSEINRGYELGQVIGGSATGTVLLFVMALFIAFVPVITMMLLAGSGVANAGGIIGSLGANAIMNLPKNTLNSGAILIAGGSLGPKGLILQSGMKGAMSITKNAIALAQRDANQKNKEKELNDYLSASTNQPKERGSDGFISRNNRGDSKSETSNTVSMYRDNRNQYNNRNRINVNRSK